MSHSLQKVQGITSLGGQELKAHAGLKEKGLVLAGAAQGPRRGMLMGRTARVKVWEERIEEEVEEQEEEEVVVVVVDQRAGFPAKRNTAHDPQAGIMDTCKSRGNGTLMRVQYASAGGGSKTLRTNEEIGVFDAERYFGGAEQQAQVDAGGWVREEDQDELLEGEAGGDLPLSPLVEFGKCSQWRDAPGVGGAQAVNNRRGALQAAASSFGRRRLEGSEFTSPRTSTASSLSEVEPPLAQAQRPTPAAAKQQLRNAPAASMSAPRAAPGKLMNGKAQPASPSSRLATFLAKFKPPTPRKSPASSPIQHVKSAAAASTPPPPPRPSVLSPAKKLFGGQQYSLGLAPPKTSSSPRGRFLRAFSSSSADNTYNSLRHHSSAISAATPPSIAASSPVSPAGRSVPDPYSPVVHSASTTPTSSRMQSRSTAHSNFPPAAVHQKYSPCTTTKPDSAAAPSRCSSSGSFKQQLPFLSRKLKVYLMPDKGAERPGKHEKPEKGAVLQEVDFVSHMQRRRHTQEAKQRRRWLHAEDQVVDEDIELAERLLRVVQDQQSMGMISHQFTNSTSKGTAACSKTSSLSVKGQQALMNTNMGGGQGMKSYVVDRVSEYSSRKYDQMHPNSTSNALNCSLQVQMSPAAHALHEVTSNRGLSSTTGTQFAGHLPYYGRGFKGADLIPSSTQPPLFKDIQEATLYDSDSSSDLFEIETLASVGMGLYRRDLPVFEAKEPLQSINHSFNGFVTSSAAAAAAARPAR